MIDGRYRIGDEVYIHGYIDEIRNGTIIIRNEGGYFGTAKDEVYTIDRCDTADRMDELNHFKNVVKEIVHRSNDCWYDTKLLANAVYAILRYLMADRKDEPSVRNNRTVEDEAQYHTCATCRNKDILCKNCVGDNYEPTCQNIRQVEDEPQTDCAWK